MIHSVLTDKGQTTVPAEVRQALNLKPRQQLAWKIQEDGTVNVQPQASALALFGSLKPSKAFPGLKQEKAARRRSMAERTGKVNS